jgi:hypothetical protein
MMKRALVLVLLAGCQPVAREPSKPVAQLDGHEPALSAAVLGDIVAPLGGPLSGPPRLVVENTSTIDVDLYNAMIVDERGEFGTKKLWPHRFTCPNFEPKTHLVKTGGVFDLEAPARVFEGDACAPGPELPPGRYVVRIESGYGSQLYASAVVDLPLTRPVRLPLADHTDELVRCDEAKAQRAARLAFGALRLKPGLPADFLKGCDVADARCGTLPLPEKAPPERCTVTLHDTLLEVDRPAGDDALRGFTAWTDEPVSFVREPTVERTSASRVMIGNKAVVLEGVTGHHMHDHGGDAAKIGGMRVKVVNGTDRALPVSVKAVEWLLDFSCALPSEVKGRPKVQSSTPKQLPPGESELEIMYAPQEAYYAHCERFASRAMLEVAGQPVAVTAEHWVTRIEPMGIR